MRTRQIISYGLSILLATALLDCSSKQNISGASNYHIPGKYAKYQEPVNKSKDYIQTGWYILNKSENGFKRILDKTNEGFILDPNPIVTYDNIIEMKVEEHPQGFMMLSMKLDHQGSSVFKSATQLNVWGKIGFVLNDNLVFRANIAEEIEGPWIGIFGESYDEEEYNTFLKLIEMNKN